MVLKNMVKLYDGLRGFFFLKQQTILVLQRTTVTKQTHQVLQM